MLNQIETYARNSESVQRVNPTPSPPYTIPHYQKELRKHLPQNILQRTPWRSLYAAYFILMNVALIAAVLTVPMPWYLKLLAGVLVGIANTGLSFFAHEVLHGSIFKNRVLQDAFGFVGFGLFFISPSYWRYWHNYLHHGHTQFLIQDPDAFPPLSIYKRSKFMRFVFHLSPGSKTFVSYGYFFYWFSFQAILNQSWMRFGNKMWDKMDHRRVSIEFGFIVAAIFAYLYFIGLENIVWLAIVPFLVQNYGAMSYISTNHNLNPLTKTNDPLDNSLTVTNHPILEFFYLNFGYHVEHHLFPTMSPYHAKKVHALLKQQYGERYHFMTKAKAMKMLYQTARIYKGNDQLIHPKTLKVYPTL
jgi:fatty acid desaturase